MPNGPLDAAERIILRTRIHPGLGDLAADPRVTDCDDLYQRAGDFGDLYPAIAQRVLGWRAHARTSYLRFLATLDLERSRGRWSRLAAAILAFRSMW